MVRPSPARSRGSCSSAAAFGVLGLTTEYTPYMVEKSAFAPFEMTSAAEAAARHIPAMRAAGADVVVVLTHMPFYQAADGTLTGELPELIDTSSAAEPASSRPGSAGQALRMSA